MQTVHNKEYLTVDKSSEIFFDYKYMMFLKLTFTKFNFEHYASFKAH